ncbi:MAG: hypothetical protein ACREQN_03285 [Candidatus Binataceae bacterium]
MYHQDYTTLEFPLEPDSILPSQFYGGRTNREVFQPVQRLMLAVLADAVRCFQTGIEAKSYSRRREFIEVEQWLFGAKVDGPFSFESVCGALNIGPDCLRKALRTWRVKKRAGVRVPMVRRSPVIITKQVTPSA